MTNFDTIFYYCGHLSWDELATDAMSLAPKLGLFILSFYFIVSLVFGLLA